MPEPGAGEYGATIMKRHMFSRSRRRGRRGFSLMECVVCLLIFAATSLILLGIIRASSRVAFESATTLKSRREVSSFIETFTRDVKSSVSIETTREQMLVETSTALFTYSLDLANGQMLLDNNVILSNVTAGMFIPVTNHAAGVYLVVDNETVEMTVYGLSTD